MYNISMHRQVVAVICLGIILLFGIVAQAQTGFDADKQCPVENAETVYRKDEPPHQWFKDGDKFKYNAYGLECKGSFVTGICIKPQYCEGKQCFGSDGSQPCSQTKPQGDTGNSGSPQIPQILQGGSSAGAQPSEQSQSQHQQSEPPTNCTVLCESPSPYPTNHDIGPPTEATQSTEEQLQSLFEPDPQPGVIEAPQQNSGIEVPGGIQALQPTEPPSESNITNEVPPGQGPLLGQQTTGFNPGPIDEARLTSENETINTIYEFLSREMAGTLPPSAYTVTESPLYDRVPGNTVSNGEVYFDANSYYFNGAEVSPGWVGPSGLSR